MRIAFKRREDNILLFVGIVLLLFWLLALGSSFTLGGFTCVAVFVGCILVVVSLVTRFRGHR